MYLLKCNSFKFSTFVRITLIQCCAFVVFSFRLSVSVGETILFAKLWFERWLVRLGNVYGYALAYVREFIIAFPIASAYFGGTALPIIRAVFAILVVLKM